MPRRKTIQQLLEERQMEIDLEGLRKHLEETSGREKRIQKILDGDRDKPKKAWDPDTLPDLPPAPNSTLLQPDPLVVGSPMLAQVAKAVLDLDPETKARAGIITQGPNESSMRLMDKSGLPMDYFDGTSLAGVTDVVPNDTNTRAVGIQPGMSDYLTVATLIHELAHVAGGYEGTAEKAETFLKERPVTHSALPKRKR